MKVAEIAKKRAIELMESGTVTRVLGWKKGELATDRIPAVFETASEMQEFVYDEFCGANLSKYLIEECKKDGKTLAFLKPCDTYSMNQLLKEHRVKRDGVYIVGIGCTGKVDMCAVRKKGVVGVEAAEVKGTQIDFDTIYGKKSIGKAEVLLEKCRACKGKKHMIADEVIGESEDTTVVDRFECVREIEEMTALERFEFWKSMFSKCLRCNACRNVCPACSCLECVFDNPKSGISSKTSADPFEDQLYHVIRAYHVAGRCTDCGECSRVCPQSIPLHLLNRKLIKDMNELYGEYAAGADSDALPPLTAYTAGDVEPNIISDKGGDK